MSDVNKQLLDALKAYVTAGFGNSTDFTKQGIAYDLAIEAIAAAEQAQQAEPVALVNAIQYLWQIIDDIDLYGDLARSDDKLFRSLVEKRQKDRWKTGITTDGYVLTIPVGSQPAVAVPDGYALVPIDPTPEMVAAGAEGSSQFYDHAQFVYRAMLDAAPKP